MHTVYVPADRYPADLPRQWGDRRRRRWSTSTAASKRCAPISGLSAELAAAVAPRVLAKLDSEPIEDLRLDFEDGYGNRGDDVEDADAVRAAAELAAAIAAGERPPSSGSGSSASRRRPDAAGMRTLDLFLGTLLANRGELPDGLVITLPKVTTVGQVEAMVMVCASWSGCTGCRPADCDSRCRSRRRS